MSRGIRVLTLVALAVLVTATTGADSAPRAARQTPASAGSHCVLPRSASVESDCSTDSALCLQEGRFFVEATWTKADGSSGMGHPVNLGSDSGFFWFFEPNNIELVVKTLNGCSVNGHDWFFAGGLTNLDVAITVTDSATSQVRSYSNPQGIAFLPIADTAAFGCPAGAQALFARDPEEPPEDAFTMTPLASVAMRSAVTPGCAEGGTVLCFNGRFQIEATWQTASGSSGSAHAVPLTTESGYFWFFDASNVELIVKTLDACGIDRGQWFFAAGLTTVGVQVRVTDTLTGDVRMYSNPLGTKFLPIQDTAAFPFCPTRVPAWPQWGRNPQHTSSSPVLGQPLSAILADIVYDPFAPQEIAEGEGALLAHYPAPLIEGDDVYMELKSGSYVPCDPPGSGQPFPCGPDARNSQVWNVMKLSWRNGTLTPQWTFESDWKPEPVPQGSFDFEPVFHPVLAGGFLYVPGLGGTVHKVSKATGIPAARVNPFADLDPTRFVAGGLAADGEGHVIYNAIQLDPSDPWGTDVVGGWLVRIAGDDTAARTDFASLVAGAPAPTDLCQGVFTNAERPWPPSPTAVPPSSPCGSQRPSLNVVPAIAPDGTIYTISRAHLNVRYGYVVAVHPDLTPAWAASMRGILNDGCGITVPIDDTINGCRTGTTIGVDPQTNDRPAGLVLDRLTSSPVVLPDGAVLYAPKTGYNEGAGHLFKYGPDGVALATYDAGFDLTPAVFEHDGTYSIKVKHNFFGPPDFEQYYLVSVDANLVPEWTFINRNTQSCVRQPDGTVACVDDHPEPFEWCVNQPAVDAAGTTYANSDDGHLYAIDRSGQLQGSIFLDVTLGAAYEPVSIGNDGRIYAQNSGHLLVVGQR